MNPNSEAVSFELEPSANASETSLVTRTSADRGRPSASSLLNNRHPSDAVGDTESASRSRSSISGDSRCSSFPAPESQAASTTDKPLLKKTGKFLAGKDSWLWEITSLIFSAACVVAMVGVLIGVQGTSLSAWHLLIAPNTAISAPATASKTSLLLPVTESISQLKWVHFNRAHRLSDMDLYNSASRGPLGALVFLFRLPLSLGALGAIITIAALGFDPFTQQLVSFPSRQAAMDNETASFKVSQAYESGAYWNYQNNVLDYTDFAMQGAILNGLFGSPSPRAFTCPTSNCTWPQNPSYLSLAVNTCESFQSTLSTDCTITTPGGFKLGSKREHESATPKIGNLSEFEVLECRLSLAGFLYSNVSVTQNILNIQDETHLSLEPVNAANSRLNLFRPAGGDLPEQAMFAVHGADLAKIHKLLQQIFIAEAMFPFGDTTDLTGVTTDVLIAGNISRIVENIALGITEQIRTGPNSTDSNGVAYQSETYINVNWPWITLPVLVVIGAAALLACSIISNSQHRGALWKSSNLAVLFHIVNGVGDYGHLPSSNDAPLDSGDNMEFTHSA
ncbi:hypothetical protein BDV40DRAFT_311337 [Aspergillus tamarii]|uniref:Uncharacterized protein n=1 Tax=Aspergillus tamarii TaxID=41984 RepID=A0A5N6VAI0_ASPTM|nr:hypothetical protein BDV40DRAFT_311337 [Aspergillus tamarii]